MQYFRLSSRCLEIHMTRHGANYEGRDVIHKTGSTKRIAAPPEEDRAMASVNMHKNGAVWPCGF